MEEVGRHRLGSGPNAERSGRGSKSGGREKRYRKGGFQTTGEAVAWCAKELGVEVSYKKLYDWFRRWGYRKKVPRPMAEKADH
jgi:transposase